MADGASEARRDEEISLEVNPRECLHDVSTTICVSGLPPNSCITLALETHNDEGGKFNSYAHYVSDERGRVDVARSEAVGGSYTGVFPAGLFSTLRETPYNHTRLYKQDPTTPWQMKLAVCSGHVSAEEASEQESASAVLYRHLMRPGMRRVQVRHGRLRGALFLPGGSGPFPGLVDIFGASGGLRDYRAAMLASRGFASLALAFFKYEDLPETVEALELEYFEEAVEFLLSQPEVVPDRCGIVSSSKGSEMALAMGIHLDKAKAIVCIGGMVVPTTTSLTFRGRELWRGVRLSRDDVGLDVSQRERRMREILRHDHPVFPPVEAASVDTHFLLAAGDRDTCHAGRGAEAVRRRMELHGREGRVRALLFPGAGHIIEPPYNALSDHSRHRLPEGTDMLMYWGGEAEPTCRAQEDLWREIRSFLALHVLERSSWYQRLLEEGRSAGGAS